MADNDLPRQFGPYLLTKLIGRGGGGEVYLATRVDPQSGVEQKLVVKRPLPEMMENEEFVLRFRHEAELARRIDSPYVAGVLDVGTVGSVHYFAQELIAGVPLSQTLVEMREAQRRGTVTWMVDLISGALLGLHALHTAKDDSGVPLGIVHRDIAPKNIMIADNRVARLIDLGIGRSNMRDWETRTGLIMGSPGYMAPEQVLGRAVDHRADLYAIGVVLWELATASRYIERAPLQQMLRMMAAPKYRSILELRSDLPPELDAILRRAVSVAPGDRFQSAMEMLSALEALLPSTRNRKLAAPTPKATALPVQTWAPDADITPMIGTELTPPRPEAPVALPIRRSAPLWVPRAVLVVSLLSFVGMIAWFGQRPNSGIAAASQPDAEVAAPAFAAEAIYREPIINEAPADAGNSNPPAAAPVELTKTEITKTEALKTAPTRAPVKLAKKAIKDPVILDFEPPAPQPAPDPGPPIEEYVDSMIQRAVRLQRRFPVDSGSESTAYAEMISNLLNDLNILRGSPRLWNERVVAERYERRLLHLEKIGSAKTAGPKE